ncbi:MAG: thermonuclease family protein [Nitratireductor sp.]|nr:thermonuclease family protein [Nitratireductor sp.]MCB1457666.1 thermonuclease family protein [Nitratireductor sp.]
MRIPAVALTCLFGLLPVSGNAGQGRSFPGPVSADVVEVVDGDSIRVSAHVWPGQQILVSIRIRGIDAPEMKARCASEKGAALAARARTASLVSSGTVVLTNISGGKYYGRMLADVSNVSGHDLAANLLAEKLVRPYSGRKRQSWCKSE